MMKTTILIVTIFLAVYAAAVLAEIYKTTDKDGNVVFTDNPSPSRPSEKVELKPITPLPPAEYVAPPSPRNQKPEASDAGYDALAITSPTNDSVVRNNGNFLVNVRVKPGLQGSHKLRLFVDGEVLAGPQKSKTFPIENMYRGTHRLQVEIVDGKGKSLMQTASVIHVQRPFVRPEQENTSDPENPEPSP
ncbi:MAG: DUF4124 domain-containing protein [Endozoicomonas sp.]